MNDRIQIIVEACERAAAGDLEARVLGLETDPAYAAVSRAVNRMLDTADAFVRESAAAMDHCSRNRFHRPILQRGLAGAYRQGAATINRAGRVMRERAAQVGVAADLARDTAASVQSAAAACEELRATASEISRQVGESAERTHSVVDEVRATAAAAAALNDDAARIKGILKLITRVAGQTKLLALNATIEAARAGEHGRGFAVVATEVKDLSTSTARAAQEIEDQIVRMLAATEDVTMRLAAISQAIEQIGTSAFVIESSVDEQVRATADISKTITEVSENSATLSSRMEARDAA
ncbi:MAG: methyl-accepting chemotaxis protein [Acidobacteria bacterium]|nr:methyl-accepting chemotaxis protein [Acidobacteriota bacterium]